jgi:Fe-S oxidoreductase
MIDDMQVENIRNYGVPQDNGESRLRALHKIGFRMDEPAEYVIIAGCFQPGAMPDVLSAFKSVLESLKVDYTLLSKEYCCGWMPIGQPAVMMKDEEDIARFKELSKDFIVENFKQAESLGAKSIALFCAACEPNYSNCKDATELEFISYPELLDRHFTGGSLDMEIDYYPGCYRFRRKITPEPLDIEPTVRILQKVEGLTVKNVESKLCCYIPPHIDQITESLATKDLVTICTGCYHNLKAMLSSREDYTVSMLPELLLKAV